MNNRSHVHFRHGKQKIIYIPKKGPKMRKKCTNQYKILKIGFYGQLGVSDPHPGLFLPGQPSCLAHRHRSDFCDLRLRCPSRTLRKSQRFPRQEKAMLRCDLRVRWKVAGDLRFRAAISEPKTPSFCRISGDLAPSTRKSLAIAILRSWCAKPSSQSKASKSFKLGPQGGCGRAIVNCKLSSLNSVRIGFGPSARNRKQNRSRPENRKKKRKSMETPILGLFSS